MQHTSSGNFIVAEDGSANQKFVVDTSGRIMKYNGSTTAGNGLPSTLKHTGGQNIGAGFTLTTLLAAPADGFYRVNAYLVLRTAGTSGTIDYTITWNDGVIDQSETLSVSAPAPPGTKQMLVFPIYVNSIYAVGHKVEYTGVTGAPAYDFWVAVERF